MKADTFIQQFLADGTLIGLHSHKILIGYGTRQWLRSPSRIENKPSFYFPDFFLERPMPWSEHQNNLEIDGEELLSMLKARKIEQQPNQLVWNPPSQGQFNAAFHELKQYFSSHNLSKAVPYIFETANFVVDEFTRINILINALEYWFKYPVHLYGFWEKKQGLIGATPEILFSLNHDNRQLQTVACAGTAESSQSENLLNNPKERHEHQLVVDGIKAALQPFSSLDIGTTAIKTFGPLSHLITPIEALLKPDVSFNDIVYALHPTPALGAFPKENGMKWLKNYQTKMPRDRYGAPAGVVYNGESHCVVAIRNLQWNDHFIKIGAGCVVVDSSTPEGEWRELRNKINAIKDILGLCKQKSQ